MNLQTIINEFGIDEVPNLSPNQSYSSLSANLSAFKVSVRQAYRRLALIHHPDRGGSPEKMKQLNALYEIVNGMEVRKVHQPVVIRYSFSASSNATNTSTTAW